MKRKIVIIGLAFVLVAIMFSGCGQKPPDISKKYIIFSDSEYGIEFKHDCYGGGHQLKSKIPYNRERSYIFEYDVYYEDNDQPTGERGGIYKISGEPGYFYIYAYVNIGYGPEVYDLVIEIDPPITWKFNPENTVEYTENERYVYKYDASLECQYPSPFLNFNEKKPDSNDEIWDHISWSWEMTYKESGKVCRPKEIGVYDVVYDINYIWKRSGGATSRYTFSKNIIIEIIE